MRTLLAFTAAFLVTLSLSQAESTALPAGVTRVPVKFENGYETDPRDGGRPVILVASGLGVPAQVFRDTFKGVHPSQSGPPSDAEARANKTVLMAGLGKYGVSDAQINTVSNRYRYRRDKGQLWTHKAAAANALVKDGKVIGYEVTDPGYGYSSTPKVTVPGVAESHAKVKVAYAKDLEKNGSVAGITLEKE